MSQRLLLLACLVAGFWLGRNTAVVAAEAPIGQFVTVTSPIDDRFIARLSSEVSRLQQRALRENRPAILILEVQPGTSQIHQVLAVTRLLTSSQMGTVKTVAWVPETLAGPNVLVALACQEVVMHPDAEIGDLGRGRPVEPEDEQLMLALTQKRVNPLVSAALVKAMIDPSQQLWRVRLQRGTAENPTFETRAATRDEVETLRNSGAVIERADVIKDAGVVGTFRGGTLRDLEILVAKTSQTRPEVAQLYSLPREALRERSAEETVPAVSLIRITDGIDALQESFVIRQIERSLEMGSKTIVFEIKSPGGELLASINLAQTIAGLQDQKIRTVAYIPERALSGAAIIALGTDEIYMHGGATIGDAGPIELKPGGQFERAPEKILSPLRAALKSLAEQKGRPVALCEAMADLSLKVYQARNRETGKIWYMSEAELAAAGDEWVQGPQVRETNGELLFTVDGRRAHELLLAERPVADLEDLKVSLGLPATLKLRAIQRTWVDGLVFTLNHPAMIVLLIVAGIGSLYLELHFPTGVFGIFSCLCFALFFWSKVLGGTAGWLEVVLFALGSGCLALEIFVLPGFGVFGVSGILMVMASLIMASQSWGNLEPYADMNKFLMTAGIFSAAVTAVVVLAVMLSTFLPSVPLFEAMLLTPPADATREPQLDPNLIDRADASSDIAWLGQSGTTASVLRPSGKAFLKGRLVDVVSEGPYIPEGTAVEVVQANGSRIVVRRIDAVEPDQSRIS